MLSEFWCWVSDLPGKGTSSLSACSWCGWCYHITKVWISRVCGHTPKPPARMRNEQQACFQPFCSRGTSSRCDLLLTLFGAARAGSAAELLSAASEAESPPSWSLEEIWLPPNCPLPRPIPYQRPYAQTQTLQQYSCSCRQCWEFLTFCWQGEGEVVWFLPWQCLDYLGEQNSSAVGVLMALKWCAQGCAGWGWQQCPLGPCGVAECLGHVSMGPHLLSWLLSLQSWGRMCVLCFSCFIISFSCHLKLVEGITFLQDLYLLCKNGSRLSSCQ